MDIESHNDEESIAKRETSMWLGCFINEDSKEDDENSYFYTMEEFLERCEKIVSKKRKTAEESRPCKNLAVFIYNLSFEWSFLLPILLEKGFQFKADIDKDDEYVYNSISTKSVSSVWQVQIKFKKNSGTLLLRDLAKLYGGGLGNVAKAFNLPTQKGEIDYRLNRLHGHVITQEEKSYCFKDTRIIIDILLEEIKRGDKDFFKAVSMASYSMLKLLKRGFPRSTKPYRKYRELYPELGEEENLFVRQALSGGICYATKRFQFKEVDAPVLHIDGHQMHPSQIYLKPHPYGEGEYFTGSPTKFFKHINVCHIKVSYDDVKIHSIIKLIGRDFADDVELYVYDFEIPTMRKCYVNLEIEFIDGYCYKSRFLPWREYVHENYVQRLEAKKNHDAYNTLRFKLLNNAGAYGKFVEKPHTEIFQNIINEDGIIDSNIVQKEFDDVLKQYNAKYTYIPLASIPAWSRVELIETALKFGWENVLYFDTDSIFCLYNEETKRVLETQINLNDELGGWAVEEICQRAQFTAPKRYKLEVKEGDKLKTTIKAGGINFDFYKEHSYAEEVEFYMKEYGLSRKDACKMIDIPFDEVNIISSEWQVQRAYRVKGGTIIEFQTKKMDVQKKYIEVYNQNK
ncbi:MAG: hypothetical protein J6S67_03620 [Methanobrevibacter sp.]|nr:hypothetical protein [Methanobrevibacter sp.]